MLFDANSQGEIFVYFSVLVINSTLFPLILSSPGRTQPYHGLLQRITTEPNKESRHCTYVDNVAHTE